jgi:hypothetical protein
MEKNDEKVIFIYEHKISAREREGGGTVAGTPVSPSFSGK